VRVCAGAARFRSRLGCEQEDHSAVHARELRGEGNTRLRPRQRGVVRRNSIFRPAADRGRAGVSPVVGAATVSTGWRARTACDASHQRRENPLTVVPITMRSADFAACSKIACGRTALDHAHTAQSRCRPGDGA
jgi:hypothetical protein